MKTLVYASASCEEYLNHVAAAYKRLKLKIPQEMQKKFEADLLEMAKDVDTIRQYVSQLPEEAPQ